MEYLKEIKEKAKEFFPDIQYCNDPYETVRDCDALVICTEWDEFRELDMDRIKSMMKDHHIFDGRNIYEPEEMRSAGFNYVGIGR